jgi:biotin-(acetyl-CoA carboxylase) ligase
MAGRTITVDQVNGDSIEGIAAGIAANGALQIDLASGERIEVLAGDVTICKDDPVKE